LEVDARRLLKADAARDLGEPSTDVTANEVLGNIDAMAHTISSVAEGDPITLDLLLERHRRLLTGSRLEKRGGRLRAQQNWIGGSSFNPCGAVFVPPPFELVEEYLVDLCDFCNADSLPAVHVTLGLPRLRPPLKVSTVGSACLPPPGNGRQTQQSVRGPAAHPGVYGSGAAAGESHGRHSHDAAVTLGATSQPAVWRSGMGIEPTLDGTTAQHRF
jgi:hypothetical protein